MTFVPVDPNQPVCWEGTIDFQHVLGASRQPYTRISTLSEFPGDNKPVVLESLAEPHQIEASAVVDSRRKVFFRPLWAFLTALTWQGGQTGLEVFDEGSSFNRF